MDTRILIELKEGGCSYRNFAFVRRLLQHLRTNDKKCWEGNTSIVVSFKIEENILLLKGSCKQTFEVGLFFNPLKIKAFSFFSYLNLPR